MPRQRRQMAESGIYHVMLRGVNRDVIFLEDEDRVRFLHALARTREVSGCLVLAYCLMDNHVHLVLRTAGEPIGTVVKRLGIRYAGWFNTKYGRVGYLFQDRFKSVPVETDAQLTVLVRYVWNNPVEAGLVARAEQFPWSSRRFLLGGSTLVDVAELEKLLPPATLSALADAAPLRSTDGPVAPEWTQGRTDRARILLRRVAGVRSPEEFGRLDLPTRRRLIRELRTRSVPYEQIAGATGMSTSAVRRFHLGVGPGEP